jgi:hypothetical protein
MNAGTAIKRSYRARAMNDNLRSRLENWKFASATNYLDDGCSPEDKDLILALSSMYGDCGWFDGNQGILIGAAVSLLLSSGESSDA